MIVTEPSLQDPSPDRQETHPIWLILILFMAAILRLLLLGDKPFWADEGIAWWMALGEIEHDAPAIYRYAFGWAAQLFGWNEFAGRLPSALFGVLSVAVIYAIGKTVFNHRFGLSAAVLASISAYLIPLSQEINEPDERPWIGPAMGR